MEWVRNSSATDPRPNRGVPPPLTTRHCPLSQFSSALARPPSEALRNSSPSSVVHIIDWRGRSVQSLPRLTQGRIELAQLVGFRDRDRDRRVRDPPLLQAGKRFVVVISGEDPGAAFAGGLHHAGVVDRARATICPAAR